MGRRRRGRALDGILVLDKPAGMAVHGGSGLPWGVIDVLRRIFPGEFLELVHRIDLKLRSEPLIRRVDWTMGESPPPFYYNLYRSKDGIPNWAEALVLTRDENLTDDLIRRLQSEMDQEFPEARVMVRGIDMGPPVLAPIQVEVFGPDLGVLKELGDQFRQCMENIPQITHTHVDAAGGAPKLVFEVDEHKLRLARLQLSDAATALNDGLLGRLARVGFGRYFASLLGVLVEGVRRDPAAHQYHRHADRKSVV